MNVEIDELLETKAAKRLLHSIKIHDINLGSSSPGIVNLIGPVKRMVHEYLNVIIPFMCSFSKIQQFGKFIALNF